MSVSCFSHSRRKISLRHISGLASAHSIDVIFLEDDTLFRESLVEFLSLHLVNVTCVPSVFEFKRAFQSKPFQVALLDANLTDGSGFDVAESLRKTSNIGIIILTALSQRADRLHGYEKGADLFFTKPVDEAELVLAIFNLAERTRMMAPALAPAIATSPVCGPWQLHVPSQRLASPEGEAIRLSGREMNLVVSLANANGQVVSRRELSVAVGYRDGEEDTRALDAVLRRMRKKAREANIDLPIHVVHAVGFRFSSQVEIDHGLLPP